MDVYGFLNTTLIINGVNISGFDEGDDTINAARRVMSGTLKVGTDGKGVYSQSADRSGEIAFKLLQTSASNAYLSALVAAAEVGAFVPLSVQWLDSLNRDLISGTQGFIEKTSDMVRGTNAQSQEWKIIVEKLNMLHVGAV